MSAVAVLGLMTRSSQCIADYFLEQQAIPVDSRRKEIFGLSQLLSPRDGTSRGRRVSVQGVSAARSQRARESARGGSARRRSGHHREVRTPEGQRATRVRGSRVPGRRGSRTDGARPSIRASACRSIGADTATAAAPCAVRTAALTQVTPSWYSPESSAVPCSDASWRRNSRGSVTVRA